MTLSVYFLDVGLGNMTVVVTPTGGVLVYDCHLTARDDDRIFGLLERLTHPRGVIDVFVASHQDPEHLEGLRALHRRFAIRRLCYAPGPARRPETRAEAEFVALRGELMRLEARPGMTVDVQGHPFLVLHAGSWESTGPAPPTPTALDDLSIVLRTSFGHGAVLLTGDTGYRPWHDEILPRFYEQLRASVLVASDHGSERFFYGDQPSAYLSHLQAIRPKVVVVSVGTNSRGLPDETALRLYEYYTSGLPYTPKVLRTDETGDLVYRAYEDGSETLEPLATHIEEETAESSQS